MFYLVVQWVLHFYYHYQQHLSAGRFRNDLNAFLILASSTKRSCFVCGITCSKTFVVVFNDLTLLKYSLRKATSVKIWGIQELVGNSGESRFKEYPKQVMARQGLIMIQMQLEFYKQWLTGAISHLDMLLAWGGVLCCGVLICCCPFGIFSVLGKMIISPLLVIWYLINNKCACGSQYLLRSKRINKATL